jgi:hypothetical protein
MRLAQISAARYRHVVTVQIWRITAVVLSMWHRKGSAACGTAKTEAITMPLNFWILGDRPSSLEVDFSEETSVYALIHAIKEEATPTLINVAHNAIDLWKVSIPSTISAN